MFLFSKEYNTQYACKVSYFYLNTRKFGRVFSFCCEKGCVMASLCSLRGEVGSGICVYWIAAACVAQPWVYGGARWARQLFGCCCVVWQRGAQEGANMRELRGECGRTEGAIRGTEGRLGEQRSERGGTEGRERKNRGARMRKQRDGRGGTEGMEEREWYVLRAVWGEVGGHGVMVRGCDGAVDTAAVWFPVV